MERMRAMRAGGLAFDSIAECLDSEAVLGHEDRGTLADIPVLIAASRSDSAIVYSWSSADITYAGVERSSSPIAGIAMRGR